MDGEGGAGGDRDWVQQRTGTKRNFSTMSGAHDRSTSPYGWSAPRDAHHGNERSHRRSRGILRLEDEDIRPQRAVHYSGDGLDFRRPVMSGSVAASRLGDAHGVNNGGNTQDTAIDLTDEDGMEESQASGRPAPGPAAASSSTAQRLPRFGRDLLELESSPEPDHDDMSTARLPGASYLALPRRHNPTSSRSVDHPQYSMLRRPTRPPSPPTVTEEDEIEFVRERPRGSRQLTPFTLTLAPARSGPRSVTPYPGGVTDNVIDLTAENDDDVVLVNSRRREGRNNDGANVAAPQLPAAGMNFGHLGHLAALVRDGGIDYGGRLYRHIQAGLRMDAQDADDRAARQMRDIMDHNRNREQQELHAVARAARLEREFGARGRQAAHRPPGLARAMPGIMNYDAPAFDLGLPGGHRPPTPKYSPPGSPGPGFTRSPEEDEVVVCPNCGDELAMGDGDTKQEVWVVKTCGHAYCGECAQARGKSTPSKKGKGKAPAVDSFLSSVVPFKKCVVDGCGKPTAKNSMVRVYLGT